MKKLLIKLSILISFLSANFSSTFAMGGPQDLDPVEQDDISFHSSSTSSDSNFPGSGQALGTNIQIGAMNSLPVNSNLPEEYLKEQRRKYERRQKGKEKADDKTYYSSYSSNSSSSSSSNSNSSSSSSAIIEDGEDTYYDAEDPYVSNSQNLAPYLGSLGLLPDEILLDIMSLVAANPNFEIGVRDLLSVGSTCVYLYNLLQDPCLSIEKLNIVLNKNESIFVNRLILTTIKLIEYCNNNVNFLQNVVEIKNSLRFLGSRLKIFMAQGRGGSKLDPEFFETINDLDMLVTQFLFKIPKQDIFQLMDQGIDIFNLNIENDEKSFILNGKNSFLDKYRNRLNLISRKQNHERLIASDREDRNLLRALNFAILGFLAMSILEPVLMNLPSNPDDRTFFQRVFPVCGLFMPAFEYGMKKIIPERIKRAFSRFLIKAKYMIYRGTKLGLEGISILMGIFMAICFIPNVNESFNEGHLTAGVPLCLIFSSLFFTAYALIHRFM